MQKEYFSVVAVCTFYLRHNGLLDFYFKSILHSDRSKR